jgi:hypothetical protein
MKLRMDAIKLELNKDICVVTFAQLKEDAAQIGNVKDNEIEKSCDIEFNIQAIDTLVGLFGEIQESYNKHILEENKVEVGDEKR